MEQVKSYRWGNGRRKWCSVRYVDGRRMSFLLWCTPRMDTPLSAPHRHKWSFLRDRYTGLIDHWSRKKQNSWKFKYYAYRDEVYRKSLKVKGSNFRDEWTDISIKIRTDTVLMQWRRCWWRLSCYLYQEPNLKVGVEMIKKSSLWD